MLSQCHSYSLHAIFEKPNSQSEFCFAHPEIKAIINTMLCRTAGLLTLHRTTRKEKELIKETNDYNSIPEHFFAKIRRDIN